MNAASRSPAVAPAAGTAGRADPVVSFAKKPQIRLLRAAIPLAARVAPGFTARRCLKLFLTPGRKPRPAWETRHHAAAASDRIVIGGRSVALYRWGPSGRKVLLCHAWGGRATQLGDFVPELTARGFEVIGFDAPAHGDSAGRRTDMVEYSNTIAAIARREGPLHAVIGHSFGAGNTIFCRHRGGLPVTRIVLIGCFCDGEWVIDRFGELLNVPAGTVREMKRTHESWHGRSISWSGFDIAAMARADSVPTMIVHDRRDAEIPFFHAERFAADAAPHISLLVTSGLGHRKVVRDAGVIRAVCDFVENP